MNEMMTMTIWTMNDRLKGRLDRHWTSVKDTASTSNGRSHYFLDDDDDDDDGDDDYDDNEQIQIQT